MTTRGLGAGLRPSLWSAWLSVATSSATLLCCALPALLVALGLGAVVAGLASDIPGLIWLSAHKGGVFAVAGVLLIGAGALQWHARRLPCPIDAHAAAACQRVRRISAWVYGVSVGLFLTGALFAFGLPWWMG